MIHHKAIITENYKLYMSMYIMILCAYIYLYQEKAGRTNTKKLIMFISAGIKIIGVIKFSSFYFHVVWQFFSALNVYYSYKKIRF